MLAIVAPSCEGKYGFGTGTFTSIGPFAKLPGPMMIAPDASEAVTTIVSACAVPSMTCDGVTVTVIRATIGLSVSETWFEIVSLTPPGCTCTVIDPVESSAPVPLGPL